MSEDWRHRAACRDYDPELFFPVGSSGPSEEQTRKATAVCARCPVRAECLEDALRVGDGHGIRGGATAGERRDMREARGMIERRPRMSSRERILDLHARGLTAEQVADDLEVHPDTVRRAVREARRREPVS